MKKIDVLVVRGGSFEVLSKVTTDKLDTALAVFATAILEVIRRQEKELAVAVRLSHEQGE